MLLRCKLEHADPQSTAQGICIKRARLWTQEHSPSASRSPIAPSHLKGDFRCHLLVLLVFDWCRRGCLSCPVSDFTHFSGVSLTVRAGGPSTRRLCVALPRCFRRWNGWRRAGGVRRSPSPSACHTHGCSGDCRALSSSAFCRGAGRPAAAEPPFTARAVPTQGSGTESCSAQRRPPDLGTNVNDSV